MLEHNAPFNVRWWIARQSIVRHADRSCLRMPMLVHLRNATSAFDRTPNCQTPPQGGDFAAADTHLVTALAYLYLKMRVGYGMA